MTDQPVALIAETGVPPEGAPGYRVLARKYRPARFADLLGQEAMVRTLVNAFASGRIAHAYILTGVRGVGKTTTARIIARCLNCVGPDGTGGPTAEPCGVCANCRDIAEDRHVDVLELDAASRAGGVGEVRELVDGVRYRPVMARYKVYIIDEVHMMTTPGFNALLKTLEEPPPHVVFIFATTEVRKVPVTVLSRCQRFDLRRVDALRLQRHFADVAAKEGVRASDAALALIARAADGSVRDGLSLLDQAIALGGGEVDEALVNDMLGLADRAQLVDLFDLVMRGEIKAALALLGRLYAAGADPALVIQDLLEITHWLTRLKVVPEAADGPAVAGAERSRGVAMAERLGMPVLARAWQMLLKGLFEVQTASAPLAAAEMALIRLAYAAELPSPAEIVAGLAGTAAPAEAATGAASAPPPGGQAPSGSGPRASSGGAPALALAGEAPQAATASEARAEPKSFAELVGLCAARREGVLHAHLLNDVHLVRFEPGRIELRPGPHCPPKLAGRLSALLEGWTGRRWVVVLSGAEGEPTLAEQQRAAVERERAAALRHPLVEAVLQAFPKATIDVVRRRGETKGPEDEPAPPPAVADEFAEPAEGDEDP
jgi:DNA polymerase-3 subunit gamma/tau